VSMHTDDKVDACAALVETDSRPIGEEEEEEEEDRDPTGSPRESAGSR
jgi:hypothetical protein